MYADNNRKIIVTLNRRLDIGPAMNALAHALAGLIEQRRDIDFIDYPTRAGWASRISRSPVIVLRGDGSGHLERLHREAQEQGLPVNSFVDTMLGASAAEQQAATAEAQASSLEYWAVAVFGDSEVLKPMTKRFSLYK